MAPDWSQNQWGWTANATDFTYTVSGEGSAVQPYVTIPVQPIPIAEPEVDSPLAWLRDQVAEVCELAVAA